MIVFPVGVILLMALSACCGIVPAYWYGRDRERQAIYAEMKARNAEEQRVWRANETTRLRNELLLERSDWNWDVRLERIVNDLDMPNEGQNGPKTP